MSKWQDHWDHRLQEEQKREIPVFEVDEKVWVEIGGIHPEPGIIRKANHDTNDYHVQLPTIAGTVVMSYKSLSKVKEEEL